MSTQFPILRIMSSEIMRKYAALGCPKSIPWAVIAPHERQADRNHGQTLKQLASRGGLSACEAVAVLEDRDWTRMTDEAAVARLLEFVRTPPVGDGSAPAEDSGPV